MKYHAQFLLDKEKDNPTAKLRYRIKWSGFIVAFNIGYRIEIEIEIEKWSKDTQRCKINTSHGKKKIPASIINRKINDYELACESVFFKFYNENKTPTADEFRAEFSIVRSSSCNSWGNSWKYFSSFCGSSFLDSFLLLKIRSRSSLFFSKYRFAQSITSKLSSL